jgi:hypothetical protein
MVLIFFEFFKRTIETDGPELSELVLGVPECGVSA